MSLLWNLVRSLFSASPAQPADPEPYLRSDNPRLVALERRYADLRVPMADSSQWTEHFVAARVELQRFRGELAYVYQLRDGNDETSFRLTEEYLASTDRLGLRQRLTEDSAFGVSAFMVDGRILTRDLLDSMVEIGFLDRHLGISQRRLRVLDIGAGYGRLAHRLVQAFPGGVDVLCVDGVPASTFLSEFYLKHRGASPQATVVPLDEIEAVLSSCGPVDVALNIHSFSECPISAIEGWLDLLIRHRIPRLMLVPNALDNGGTRLLSFEADGSYRDLMPLLQAKGFKLVANEPKYADAAVQARGVSPTRHYLFARD
jgi:putative sugar O-methyltransferase